MTATDIARPAAYLTGPRPSPAQRQRSMLARHAASIGVLAPLLIVVGLANTWNLQGWPGRVNDDEGTYVAEAWAMIVPHHLSQYTYWYDHPPLGWGLMALWIWVTRGFQRYPSEVMAGREFMLVVTVVSCGLLYILARRLRFRRLFAALAVVLFGFSPLAIYFHRMVFLDNISTMWLLVAMVFALSLRRSLASALGSGIAFALACLSKETIGILLPAVVWMLWRNAHVKLRSWNLAVFGATFVLLLLGYPLFAALRGELLPGPGHVSLAGALIWQFANRSGSGSLLNLHSGTFYLAKSWVDLDPVVLLGGVALIPFCFAVRGYRPLALGLGIQVVILLRGGYVPYMYVTAMLPFAALLMAGAVDRLWPPYGIKTGARAKTTRTPWKRVVEDLGRVSVAVVLLAFAVFVAPTWVNVLRQQSVISGAAGSLAATAWINANLPKGSIVVVDDYVWPDVTVHGKADPLWCWKVDGDPWIAKHVLPDGYKSIDYIVLPATSSCELNHKQLPTLVKALAHSKVIKTFADGITARKVIGR